MRNIRKSFTQIMVLERHFSSRLQLLSVITQKK